jgi:hypothetical protein
LAGTFKTSVIIHPLKYDYAALGEQVWHKYVDNLMVSRACPYF